MERAVQKLNEILDFFPRALIAYSGGVDSAYLLYAAYQRLGNRVLGVIADSPSLPRSELVAALDLAASFNLEVEVIQTNEFENPQYLSNPINRCYFCKHSLFEKMQQLALCRGFPILAYGENADDVNEFRPGSIAAGEFQVRAPLKEAGLGKSFIRVLSANCGLPTADKPASPCLSSRIPHGNVVTREALAQVETGEEAIRKLGFRVFRLRHHGSRARIEFAAAELSRAQSSAWQSAITEVVLKAGYHEVEIDSNGYRTQGVQKTEFRSQEPE